MSDINKEIILAEILLSESVGGENTANNQNDCEGQLAQINEKLDKYINKADKTDYCVAVASGILSGFLDVIFVGDFDVGAEALKRTQKKLYDMILASAQRINANVKSPNSAIRVHEKKFPVAHDSIFKKKCIGVNPKNHHLADIAHHPTPLGLAASIMVQFINVGLFNNKKGETHFVVAETKPIDSIISCGSIVITGILSWLVRAAEEKYEEDSLSELPQGVRKIIQALVVSPIALTVLKCANNWCGHLLSDINGTSKNPGKGMGIPGLFLSLAKECSLLPGVNSKKISEKLERLYTKERINMRTELPFWEALGKQAMPVIINEIVVRTFYFVRRLIGELKSNKDLSAVDWKNVIPFNNRTINRMLMISEATFTAVDMADATLRAAIDSGGMLTVFAIRLVGRVNYVGLGRLTVSVVKEVCDEAKEAEIIHERMLLAEKISQQNVAAIQAYRNNLENMIDEYMAEQLKGLLCGCDDMEKALSEWNSDGFIGGNVTIQRVLGHAPQFSSQNDFDALMKSKTKLKL